MYPITPCKLNNIIQDGCQVVRVNLKLIVILQSHWSGAKESGESAHSPRGSFFKAVIILENLVKGREQLLDVFMD